MTALLAEWWRFVNRVIEVGLMLVGLNVVVGQWWGRPEDAHALVLGLGVGLAALFTFCFIALACHTFATLGARLSR